jgi:hypothetical protein
MARPRVSIPTLKDRIELMAYAYAEAKQVLGEDDPKTVEARDALLDCCEHLLDVQHPQPVDPETGQEVPRTEPMIDIDKCVWQHRRWKVKDELRGLDRQRRGRKEKS